MPDPILTAPAPATPAAPAAAVATPAAADPAAVPATTTPAAAATATPAATTPAAPAPPAAPAAPAAPASYDLKPSKPDALPAEAVTQVAEIAKDLGLTQEGAQKLLARHEAAFAAHQTAIAEARAKRADAWYDQIAADKEFGGKNLSKTTDDAKRAFATLSPDDQREIIDGGFQNNPILVKLLAQRGAALGEGSIAGRPSQGQPSSFRTLYPSMPNP